MAPPVTRTKVKNVNAKDTKPTIDEAVLIFEPMNAALYCALSTVHSEEKSPMSRTRRTFQLLTSFPLVDYWNATIFDRYIRSISHARPYNRAVGFLIEYKIARPPQKNM